MHLNVTQAVEGLVRNRKSSLHCYNTSRMVARQLQPRRYFCVNYHARPHGSCTEEEPSPCRLGARAELGSKSADEALLCGLSLFRKRGTTVRAQPPGTVRGRRRAEMAPGAGAEDSESWSLPPQLRNTEPVLLGSCCLQPRRFLPPL